MTDAQSKKIAVIGGGIAGLSAGCYARMNGYDVDIYEMHNLPGGLCTSWKRKGFTFDNCIHRLSGTTPRSSFHRIWRKLGALQGKELYYKEITVKLFLKDCIIPFYNNPEKLAGALKEVAPEDGKIIDELAESIRKYYWLDKLPLSKARELCGIADRLGTMKSLFPFLLHFGKYARTTIDGFAGRFTNPVLRKAFRSLKSLSAFDDYVVIPFLLGTEGEGFP